MSEGGRQNQKKLIGTITSVDAATGTISVDESNGARAMTFHRHMQVTVASPSQSAAPLEASAVE